VFVLVVCFHFDLFFIFIFVPFAMANIFFYFFLNQQNEIVVSSSRSPPRPGYTLKSSTLPVNGRQNGGDYLVNSNFSYSFLFDYGTFSEASLASHCIRGIVKRFICPLVLHCCLLCQLFFLPFQFLNFPLNVFLFISAQLVMSTYLFLVVLGRRTIEKKRCLRLIFSTLFSCLTKFF
jgi:hypothetical protein